MTGVQKCVIRVLPRTECANAIQLVEENGVQKVVNRSGIVWVPLLKNRELLDRAVILHVVEVIESLATQ